MTNNENKITYADKVSNRIIEALELGVAPWQKSWSGSDLYGQCPVNAKTGNAYSGINALHLMLESQINGYSDNRWVTYKQALDLDGMVNKGERGTTIQYWKTTETKNVVDDNGKVIDKEEIKLENPRVFYATVFNANQTTLEPLLKEDLPKIDFNPNELAENILKNSGADIRIQQSEKAFYRPSKDFIQLPLREQFTGEAEFYSTALHELGHWTGHKTRLNRDLTGGFGSEKYAKEELRAEISSYMLSQKIGIDFDPTNHFAYVDNWIKALKEDNREIFKAARDAEKIADYIEGLSLEKEQGQVKEIEQKDELITQKDVNILEKEYEFSYMLLGRLQSDCKVFLESDNPNINRLWAGNINEQIIEMNKLYDSFPIEIKPNWICAEDIEKFRKDMTDKISNPLEAQTYLHVPYSQKEQAKEAGAKYDPTNKAWYAPKGADANQLKEWLLINQDMSIGMSASSSDPISDFRDELLKRGFELKGSPIADGNIHRCRVTGDTGGQLSGAYLLHNDGRPAGFIQDFKNGTKENWKHLNTNFSANVTKEEIKQQAETNRLNILQKEIEQKNRFNEVAIKTSSEFKNANSAADGHSYLNTKGIQPTKEIKLDDDGNLLIPFHNLEGNVRTVQRIKETRDNPNEFIKMWEKGGEKRGNFHFIDGNKKDILIVCEGYATGASLNQSTSYPVAVAGDAGNLKAVLESIIEPQKNNYEYNRKIIIAVDNDAHKGEDKNIGLLRSKEAVSHIVEKYPALKDKVVLAIPSFTKEEKANKLTDFNDLAQSRGNKAVDTQISVAVQKLVQTQVVKNQNKQMQKTSSQGQKLVR